MNSLILSLLMSSSPTLQVKVDGEGYVRFSREGRSVFAREFTLTVTDGKLTTVHGLNTVPTVQVGPASKLRISKEGDLFATLSGTEVKVATLVVAQFPKTASLSLLDNYFVSPERPAYSSAGENGAGFFSVAEPAKGATAPIPAVPKQDKKPQAQPAVIAQGTPAKGSATTLPAGKLLRVVIKADALVASDTYSLLDIAEVEGSQLLIDQLSKISLGSTPALGLQRSFELERTKLQLRAAKLPVEAIEFLVPEQTKIRRPSQSVEYPQIFAIAEAALRPGVGSGSTLTDQSQNPNQPLILPIGNMELRANTPSWSGFRGTVLVDAFVDGKKIKSRSIVVLASSQFALPKSGQTVKAVVISPGMKIQFTGRVTRTFGLNMVEIRREDGVSFTGTLIGDGVIEVKI